jgi:other hect domain ubiquitin protein ligase E3
MECNESLCRRLERTYQLTRHFRTHGRYAMTHGKQRVFYADFLSKMYLSDRKQRHSLHRRPLLAGYVHDSRNAFLHGCTCCAAEPDPLFTTWANRSIMQLRPADTGSSNGNISDSTANVEGGAAVEAADRTSGSLNDGRAPRGPLRSSSTSLPSNGTNSTRPAHHNAQQQSPSRGGGDDDAATRSHGSGMRRHSHSGHAATPAVPSETSAAADSQGQSAATASGAAAEEEGAGSAASRSRRHHHHGSRRNRARGRESGSANAGGAAADDDAGDDDDEELNDELDSSQQGSRRGTRGGRFSFCSCGGHNSTAPHRAPAQRLRLPDLMVEGASTQGQRRAPVTVTMLPLEAMLEDPMEKVQSDPATRKAFLGKDVLSRLVPTMVPVLLSLMDNCVNPLVARHSMTLLLRCLSLCADLRAQVTGEAIELPSEISNATPEVTAPAAPAKEKSGSRFLSFRKWLTGGGSGSTSPQWQRKEWQKTMTALQCFLPSLRDLFVGLYLMEGIHIVAGRQDVFGAMKDDLLMADELARVHIAPEFCSFQLSVPSEQLTTAADAMVLLMGLFPTVKPLNAMSSSSPKTQANSVKKSSFRNLGVPTPVSHESPVESFTTFVKATHEPRTNDVVPLSPLPPLLPGFPNDTPMLMAHPAPPAGGAPAVMTTSGGAVVVSMPDAGSAATASSSPSPLPSTTQSVPSCVDSRGGGPPQRELSTSLSRKTSTSAAAPALAGTENAQGSKGVVPRPPVSTSGSDSSVSNSKTCGGGGGSGGGVFTLHQATLLVNYARQVISRGPRVCASAKQIEQSVMRNEFKSVVVLGSSELNAGTVAAPLRTKELMLRMTPAASCPYHFSFSHCTQNFFDASSSLLQVLTKACGDALSEAAVAGDAADPTVSSPKKGNGARTDSEGTALMEARRAGNNAAGNWTGESRDSDNNGHVGSAAGAAPSHSSETPAAVMSSTTIQQAAIGTEEDLPIDLKVSAVPKTVNTDELYNEVNVAASDSGPYHNLPRALRTALLFYDYCKKHDIELRAVMMEDPNFIVRLAESLERWLNTISRMREDVTLVSSMSLVALSPVKGSSPTANLSPADASSTRASDGFRRVHFDSTARGKLLRFVSELGATVSRDLGFANFNLDPSIVVKQPCSFAKRAKRVKSFGAVRHLMWRPLTVSLDMLTPESGPHAPASKTPSVGGGKAKDQPSVLVVYHVPLTVVSGVKLRKTDLAVLPNTTMAGLAAAVAKQVQLPAQPVSPNTSTSLRKTAQPSPAAVALHAVQERLPASEQPAASVLTESSPCLTSEEYFEDGTGSSTRVVTPDRILFFIGDVPMISPLTTLLDALAAYADSGFSLRYLITMEQQPGESEEAHRNRILMSLPTLPFWLCKHDIKFVVLQDPLPMELMAGITLTSTQSQPNARSCSCCETLPRFLCSPQHLFDIAPVNGPVALYAALTGIVRSEIPDEVSVLDSTQRRLSSAVVHQLYQHLSVFMLPPLLYSCGIGTAVPGASFDDVVEGDETCTSGMNFPTASYALWEYPYMFTMDMRVSILRFFISAQRSLTLEHCRHLLQSNQSLLVRRAAGEPNFGAEESRVMATTAVGATPSHADNADKRLDIVGLEWLSEEVLRRRRVTLTVDRRHILQSAEQLFALATCTLPLDVAFKGEAGIGPGPAMEFYELIVEELLKPKYGLFRTEAVPQDEGNVSDLTASRSLPTSAVSQMLSLSLPQASRRRCCNPLYPAGRQTPQSLHYWELLGLLLGRLLMMGETTSLCFHPLFLRRMVGEELMTNALAPIKNNLELLDEPLAASLQRLLTMNAEELEACDLYFTIPVSEADNFSPVTDTEKPMMEDGELRRVTRENVDEYVQRLSSFYLQTVPDLALLYLRKGLQHTVNPLYLELFTSAELGRLFGSAQDKKIWETRESFARCVEAGHGYHKRSDVVQYLLDVVPQWNAQLQHNFLKFVTGSSSVPYGGLTQVIKVVRRDIDTATNAIDSSVHHRNASSAADGTTVSESLVFSATPHNHSFGLNTAYDHTLPTVSTCFLYLKLPQYSSKAVLEERLRLAVCEGSNFFALT